MPHRIHPYGDLSLQDAHRLIRQSFNGLKLEAIALVVESIQPHFQIIHDTEHDSANVLEEKAVEFRDRIAQAIRCFDQRFKEEHGEPR